MAKKPDLSDISKKLDIGGIMDSIKSMVNPGGGTPDADPSDAIGTKIAKISTMLQEMTKVQAKQTQDLDEVNHLLNGLFNDLQALRGEPEGGASEESSEPEAKAESAETEQASEPESESSSEEESK